MAIDARAGARKLRQGIAARFRGRAAGAARPVHALGPAFAPGGSQESVHQTRQVLAAVFLRGDGLEIGALHQPLSVPAVARVRYVDRMTTPELRKHYQELASLPLVEIDVIDDGERLATFEASSQDFVIANHFIEHCQNPILTFQNLFRVLKVGGVVYMGVPDKRFTFDIDRPCTTIEHVVRDYIDGPSVSKRAHFEEWVRLVNKCPDGPQVDEQVRHLMDIDYSIHFHVWTAKELFELFAVLHQYVQFELELFLRNGFETLVILRKTV
jgi:SAM-dependent methyltransferase